MSTPPEAVSDSSSGMSEMGRLIGVFWEPRPVFQNLVNRPRFWVPLVLSTLMSLVIVYAFSQLVGWDQFLEQTLSTNQRIQELPAEQRQAIVQQQTAFMGPMMYAVAIVGSAVTFCAIAGILLLVFRLTASATVTFKQALSITVYSWLPKVLSGVIALIILFGNPRDFDLQNPAPFNVGWFLDRTTAAPWLYSLLTSIDLFTLWAVALLGLGFSLTTKKKKFGSAFGLVLSLWLVMVILGAGWASVFG